MAITLRQESDARATTKGSALTFQELDINFIELLDRSNISNVVLGGTDITVSSPDSTGAVTVSYSGTPGISDVVSDTTPQLGGNLDVNGQSIVSVSDGNIAIVPNGTGNIQLTPTSGNITLSYANWPSADGTNGYVLQTNGAGTLSWVAQSAGISNVVEDSTPQLGGTLDGQGNEINNVILEDYKETIYTGGSTTGTITPDVANGNVQSITLTGNITFNAFGNAEAGQSMTLIIKQSASGGETLTSSMVFAGGTKTLSTGANAIDILSVVYDGTTYYASLSTNFS